MKVERLLEIALDLQADFKDTNIVALTDGFVSSLQNQINAPNSENQKKISNQRDQLIQALEASKVNQYPPSWVHDLDGMEIGDYLGTRLAGWIKEILGRNQITPNDALKEIAEIKDVLNTTSKSINNLVSSLKYFEFKPEILAHGQYEISVLIPRGAIHNELGKLGKELKKIESIFLVFSEVVTGSREPFHLRAISTTDPTVFIDSIPEVAACIALTIERVVALYNGVLDLIIKHKELKDKDVPEAVLQPLKDHIGTEIKKGLEEISSDTKKKYFDKVEKTRRNHLEQELINALEDIAARLDVGYGFDVRGEPVEGTQDNEVEDDGSLKEQNTDENYKIVTASRSKIRFFKPQGDPIFGLPKPSEDDENKGKSKK